MGTPSVSEAAALLSANNSRLLVPKKKGENYTVAAALDIRTVRQGHIEIVGAGLRATPDLVSVRGRQMLERADLHSVCRQPRSQGADSLCQGRCYRTQLRFHGFGRTI